MPIVTEKLRPRVKSMGKIVIMRKHRDNDSDDVGATCIGIGPLREKFRAIRVFDIFPPAVLSQYWHYMSFFTPFSPAV